MSEPRGISRGRCHVQLLSPTVFPWKTFSWFTLDPSDSNFVIVKNVRRGCEDVLVNLDCHDAFCQPYGVEVRHHPANWRVRDHTSVGTTCPLQVTVVVVRCSNGDCKGLGQAGLPRTLLNKLFGRQAAWRLGKLKKRGLHGRTPGSSSVWEVLLRTVKLLGGPHSSKGSRSIA